MRYFIFLLLIFFASLAMGQDPIWLLVDTQKKLIQVKQGSQTLANFENISIGRQGAGHKEKSGDDITPLEDYNITYTNVNSHFRTFYGLNYPSLSDAGLALSDERISYSEYEQIIQAHSDNTLPPQDTGLGGQIGIHGVGNGDKKIQGVFDWTHGCVALSNQQIDKLAQWVYKGMQVQIK
ncbi:conserved hypothetical protein [Bathymodiolus platifrons methanotrophic gill symbiont]|uniref:L,D-transpeptidase family protein n=2 Tax=Bathymodiolus platifrons methanotrophic gill symbiont TaxID=113268 RepID=UPI000B40E3D6|nr:L,D-transpeptidase [Bathymodiolus platifrons methanotrophic gill symbiont]GAW86021.1 conserved hypothetical protein [Bathymodiolus platifrons methanotrophic gill symbiont]GFO76245.1 hypothetical protein BPLS_P3900 [Bathymodiolus platifrons methanotrophic gill symbiont]